MSYEKRDELTKTQCIANNICEKKYKKNVEKRLKFLKDITNEKYYQIKNIDKLQQFLNEITVNKVFINTKKINKKIRLIFKKNSNTSYLNQKSYINN